MTVRELIHVLVEQPMDAVVILPDDRLGGWETTIDVTACRLSLGPYGIRILTSEQPLRGSETAVPGVVIS